jgi:hypothetical protein
MEWVMIWMKIYMVAGNAYLAFTMFIYVIVRGYGHVQQRFLTKSHAKHACNLGRGVYIYFDCQWFVADD